MAVSGHQVPHVRPACGSGYAGDQPAGNLCRARVRLVSPDKRLDETFSEELLVSGSYPVQQLLHDYDVSHASRRVAVDVGPVLGDRALCGANLAVAAFWA